MLGSHEPSRSRHDHLAADSINRDDEAGRRPAAGALTTPGEKNGDARHASGKRSPRLASPAPSCVRAFSANFRQEQDRSRSSMAMASIPDVSMGRLVEDPVLLGVRLVI